MLTMHKGEQGNRRKICKESTSAGLKQDSVGPFLPFFFLWTAPFQGELMQDRVIIRREGNSSCKVLKLKILMHWKGVWKQNDG